MHYRLTKLFRLACLLPTLLVACSDSPSDSRDLMTSGEGVLRYVPADTAYVFAALESVPEEVREKLAPHLNTLVRTYADMLRAVVVHPPEDAEESGLDDETRERIAAIIDELGGMITADGIPEAGIGPESDAAIYGVGLLPVMRVTLPDRELFEAFVEKLENRAGAKMSTASIDGHEYRYAGNDEAHVIVATIGNQLVITGAPAGLPEAQLKSLLGLSLPAESIAESGALAAVSEKYRLSSFGAGFIDVERIAATFIDEQSGVNSELLALMDYDAADLSDVCKTEIRSLAGIAPRIVSGYTEVTPEHFKSISVVELRSDLAAGVQTLTAAVPGLGTERGGLIALGMSLNMIAARDFYSARLDALEADPYKCELLEDLQAGVTNGRAVLEQPVPPTVYAFRGILAVIDDIKGMDIKKQQPPTDVNMRLLVATDNPEALVAMGAMFSPDVASMDLQPDSKPVRLAVPAVASMIEAAWVAMSDDAIALSFGNGSETRLESMLGAASKQPPPFMSMNMDAGRYYSLIGDVTAASTDSGEIPEVAKANAEIMTLMGQMFDRISFDVEFTENGIEIPSTMELKD